MLNYLHAYLFLVFNCIIMSFSLIIASHLNSMVTEEDNPYKRRLMFLYAPHLPKWDWTPGKDLTPERRREILRGTMCLAG